MWSSDKWLGKRKYLFQCQFVSNTSWVVQGSNRGLCGDKTATNVQQWHDSYCTSLESCLSGVFIYTQNFAFHLHPFTDYSQFCSDAVSIFWVIFLWLHITTDSSIGEAYQISWVLPWRFKRQNLQTDKNYYKAASFSNCISTDYVHMLQNM